jgi:hypothetical protein
VESQPTTTEDFMQTNSDDMYGKGNNIFRLLGAVMEKKA